MYLSFSINTTMLILKKFTFLSLIWSMSLFLLSSCKSWLPIEEWKIGNEISLSGSKSQTSSTLETWGVTETTASWNTWSEDSRNILWPIDDGEERVTKKTFWLQVSPTNSPISREKFSGYHTGIDFETTEDEADKEIEVRAICSGPLVYKNWVSGYGGVWVQRCMLRDENVTILYGHLRVNSILSPLNTEIEAWGKIGILWKWLSTETDGERKHLHLSIHKWTTLNLKWYVQNKSELDRWMDPMEYWE